LLDVLSVVGNEFALAIEIILSLIERDRLLNENFEIRRFESLGLLCNSMSHQVNNRFQSIVNLLLNPLDIFSDGKYKEYSKEELIELLEDFANSSKKIDLISKEGGKITKDILNFSRGKMELGVVNFDEAVEKSINFLEQKHLRFKCEIKRDYPKEMLVWGSELNIKDLIFNALDNSCFSMQTKQERGGVYTPVITIRGRANETMFHFEIEDNGVGIKREDINKVMDPMFTTKGHKKGSGMGTTFMQQIVQKHGGTIAYESQWDQWAKVKIALPLAHKDQKGS
jgi:two-component system, NtrC family, sensor kinase